MIAAGEKTIETRRWPTKYRGPLLIVSSRSPNVPPAGCAIATANLVDCRPMNRSDENLARCSFYDGAYAWILDNVRRITPFPVRGQLGIYEVTVDEEKLGR